MAYNNRRRVGIQDQDDDYLRSGRRPEYAPYEASRATQRDRFGPRRIMGSTERPQGLTTGSLDTRSSKTPVETWNDRFKPQLNRTDGFMRPSSRTAPMPIYEDNEAVPRGIGLMGRGAVPGSTIPNTQRSAAGGSIWGGSDDLSRAIGSGLDFLKSRGIYTDTAGDVISPPVPGAVQSGTTMHSKYGFAAVRGASPDTANFADSDTLTSGLDEREFLRNRRRLGALPRGTSSFSQPI